MTAAWTCEWMVSKCDTYLSMALATGIASFSIKVPVYITHDVVTAAYQLSIISPDHPPGKTRD